MGRTPVEAHQCRKPATQRLVLPTVTGSDILCVTQNLRFFGRTDTTTDDTGIWRCAQAHIRHVSRHPAISVPKSRRSTAGIRLEFRGQHLQHRAHQRVALQQNAAGRQLIDRHAVSRGSLNTGDGQASGADQFAPTWAQRPGSGGEVATGIGAAPCLSWIQIAAALPASSVATGRIVAGKVRALRKAHERRGY